MKTKYIFLLLGIWLSFSSVALAVDENFLNSHVVSETVVSPAVNSIQPQGAATYGSMPNTDVFLNNHVVSETKVVSKKPTQARPAKGSWLKLAERGDTISGVAFAFTKSKSYATVRQILAANDLTPEEAENLRVGFEFFVPAKLLLNEYKNPLGKIAQLKAEKVKVDLVNQEQAQKISVLIAEKSQLETKSQSVSAEVATLTTEKSQLESTKESYFQLVQAGKAKINELGKSNKKELIEWYFLIAITVISLILAIIFARKVFGLSKEKRHLLRYMKYGRLQFAIEGKGEYVFFCPVDTDGKHNIFPFTWGGTSLVDSGDVARNAVKSLMKKYVSDKETPKERTAVKSAFRKHQLHKINNINSQLFLA